MRSATRCAPAPSASAPTRSCDVMTPAGRPAPSSTTTEPTPFARISAATSEIGRAASQTTAAPCTSERSGRANVCCSPAMRRSRWSYLEGIAQPLAVLQPHVIGLARGRQRLPEGEDAPLGEQRQKLQEDFSGEQRVAE